MHCVPPMFAPEQSNVNGIKISNNPYLLKITCARLEEYVLQPSGLLPPLNQWQVIDWFQREQMMVRTIIDCKMLSADARVNTQLVPISI